jgi:hypothetical protein
MLLPSGRRRSPEKTGRRVMVDVFAVAFLSVALGVPALILATMLGSNLNLD